MLEATGLCPFLETCETRRDRLRIEKRLLKERKDFFSNSSFLERVEYNAFMSEYQRRFTDINRIQERCSSNHKRCLRFWQKSRLENTDEKSNQPAQDWIDQITTE
jgi:hypothetical protein